MFRRIALWIATFLVLTTGVLSIANAALNDNPQRPDIVGFGADRSTAPIIGFDADGDLIPARNLALDIGESTRSFNAVWAGSINASRGLVSVHETWIDVSSADPQGLSSTGFWTSTANFANASTSYMEIDITQSSSVPRNVIIFSSAVFVATITLSGSATFYGYDATGRFMSELIYFSTRDVTFLSTMSITHQAPVFNSTGVGNVAWARISSFTVSLTSVSDSGMRSVYRYRLLVGWGNKLGLSNRIDVSTDVYKITVNGVHINQIQTPGESVIINPTYGTVVIPFGTGTGNGGAPDGEKDLAIWYRTKRSPL